MPTFIKAYGLIFLVNVVHGDTIALTKQRPGNNAEITSAAASDLSACRTQCKANSECKYYSLISGTCFLFKNLAFKLTSVSDTWELDPCDGTVTLTEPSTADYATALSAMIYMNTGS